MFSRDCADAVAGIIQDNRESAQLSVRASGRGEADPIASNKTEADRGQDRRVTVTVEKP